ncbi:MAG: SUMF1/EgtB/PvdO family nonheme iron enzyme, partial [Flavobacteriales bacterium]|nr:SUMF1/EgtB/PvdO family nonheme iron enzyme [Flavobacteriales bacterium]
GILLPRYRLPTEAEWEYAAYGLIGNALGERIIERRLWPWNGHALRNPEEKFIGMMLANYKRGRGDNMGIAGKLNDNADITAPVHSYWPNDYGLYNMAGNVSEWVMDVYRPLSHEDKTDFRSFRGNVFENWVKDEDGLIAEKDSLGKITTRKETEEENFDRRNYRRSDNINFLDGDFESNIVGNWNDPPAKDDLEEKAFRLHNKYQYADKEDESNFMYDYTITSMINDKARVYKGGSWKDRAYYIQPGTRRYLDEKQSTDYLGFRCVMDRVGSPSGF